MTKKTMSLVAVLLLVLSLGLLPAAAETEENTIYVNISNAGKLEAAMEPIALADADGDGALTVNDALILIHDAKYEGGAAAGFATADSQYGPMITKLWGVENGGSYGYYVNNTMSMGLTDPVAAGDVVYAFVYADAAGFSDAYSYFDKSQAEIADGEELTLTLSKADGFDANYAPIYKPLEGAVITVDGIATQFATDAEGKAVIKLESGSHIVSATAGETLLVPAVCAVAVQAAAAETSPARTIGIILGIVVVIALIVVWMLKGKKKN